MKIVLHAGFHKSGTTSLQTALLQQTNPDFIYPTPKNSGPGHAEIAQHSLNRKSGHYNPGLLLEIANYHKHKFSHSESATLILSSECFTDYKKFEAINRLAQEYKVQLILTRRPVKEALPSWNKELIKHGSKQPFLSRKAIKAAVGWMQFDSVKIQRFLDSSDFDKIHVIVTSDSTPDFIFDCFKEIVGLDLPTLYENPALPDNVVSRLVNLNRTFSDHSIEQRLTCAINEAIEIESPKIDSKTIDFMNDFDKDLMSFFLSLAEQKRLTLHTY